MQIHSDRFETTLPKEHFFNSPRFSLRRTRRPQPWLGFLILGSIFLSAILAVTHHNPPPPVSQPEPTPPPAPPPLPEIKPVAAPRAQPVISPVTDGVPRAQLVHIRPVGTFENDRMPDGRLLQTLYKGELPSAASLPRKGGQPGDMWFTRADQHTWVLAPIFAGSQTLGWVDP